MVNERFRKGESPRSNLLEPRLVSKAGPLIPKEARGTVQKQPLLCIFIGVFPDEADPGVLKYTQTNSDRERAHSSYSPGLNNGNGEKFSLYHFGRGDSEGFPSPAFVKSQTISVTLSLGILPLTQF